MLERIRLWLRAWLFPEYDRLLERCTRLEVRLNRAHDRIRKLSR